MAKQVKSDLDFENTGKIINLVDPVNPQDAATRAYVLAHSGGGSAKTMVELDFGVVSRGSSFTITDAGVSTTSFITMQYVGNQSTGRSADEYEFEAFSCTCVPGTGSFVARIIPLQGAVGGKYKFFYQL